SGEVAKEAIEKILRHVAQRPQTVVRDSLEELGLTGSDTAEIEAFIEKLVEERQDFINEKGAGAAGPLMGLVMGEFRGIVDGKVLSELLKQKINEFLKA
ncbi:Glu-tRNA(Gln) amidotransferase GatDE subunit E, partial [Methanococcoides sp. SA1]|nr:Glu-tRNA(Gln) amidotransferase GatDE subunit E [Methanococcoides sp. SA1]